MLHQPNSHLHVQLKLSADPQWVEFRYFGDNPNEYQARRLNLAEIAALVQRAERDYYTVLPEDYVKTGQALFRWLDGSDCFLAQALDRFQARGQVLVLAIAADAQLAHLPWEILHDGQGFLVAQNRVPLRWSGRRPCLMPDDRALPQRPLQLLFMATSPQGVEPVLDYEAEEAAILAATRKPSVLLEVEESGCLEELGYLVDEYRGDETGGFDVFHLTGHATFQAQQPVFITESQTGEKVYSTAQDICEPWAYQMPPLIWLSGCRTGQGTSEGKVASMAQGLIDLGAQAVLGWGRPVRDGDATLAAAALYDRLAAGCTLAEALASTYRTLLEGAAKGQVRDWHLLRLYGGDVLPGALIRRSNRRVRYREAKVEFLDPQQNIKVAGRTEFIGRRKPLQRALRALAPEAEALGVLIHGMGGLGKSTLAARICDRLQRRYQQLVWVGPLDPQQLVNRLAERLEPGAAQQALRDESIELKYRLRRALETVLEAGVAKPLLLVLDDFEQNLEPNPHGQGLAQADFVCKPEVAALVQALVWALEQVGGHRLLITCRYDFELSGLRRSGFGAVERVPLAPFSAADEEKKARRLRGLVSERQGENRLQQRARAVADGNPRLMEWLDKLLQAGSVDAEALLAALEGTEEMEQKRELREQVLAQTLLDLVTGEMREFLQGARIFELPVPVAVLAAVCPLLEPSDLVERAAALGLVERYPDECLRVARVLPLQESWEEGEYGRAARVLWENWIIPDAHELAEIQEIEVHRLSLLSRNEEFAYSICIHLSHTWAQKGMFPSVARLCKATLEIVKSLDRKIYILIDLASAYEEIGETESARETYIKLARKIRNAENSGNVSILKCKPVVLGNWGCFLKKIGKLRDAISNLEDAIKAEKKGGERFRQALWHNALGAIYRDIGDFKKSFFNYQKALSNLEKSEDLYRAAIYCNLCDLYGAKGQSKVALEHARRALKIQDRICDFPGKIITLHGIAEIYLDQEKYDQAIKIANEALSIAENMRIDKPGLMSELYCVIACAYMYQGQNFLWQALESAFKAKAFKAPDNEYFALLLLGIISLGLNNHGEARLFFIESEKQSGHLSSMQEVNLKAIHMQWLALCGMLVLEGQKEASDASALKARELYAKIKSTNVLGGISKRSERLLSCLKYANNRKENCKLLEIDI